MTLDRALSRSGLASRTTAAEWIRSGEVRVNRRIERDPEKWVHTDQDEIEVRGQRIEPRKPVYIMLNKPTGVITSFGDPEKRKTVYAYLTKLESWVFPVGRLDKDTSGLLLLTNETEFGHRLTDPNSKIKKKYLAKVNALLNEDELSRLRRGVELEPGLTTRPCVVNRVRQTEKYSWIEIILTEGKNRQIRRMVESLGKKVLKLVRVEIGALRLGDLPVGQWRRLTREEVKGLTN